MSLHSRSWLSSENYKGWWTKCHTSTVGYCRHVNFLDSYTAIFCTYWFYNFMYSHFYKSFHFYILNKLIIISQDDHTKEDFKRHMLNIFKPRMCFFLGQERFRSMTKTYFRRADGVILLYDVTSERSFMNVRQWIQNIDVSKTFIIVSSYTHLTQ